MITQKSREKVTPEEFMEAAMLVFQGLSQLMENKPEADTQGDNLITAKEAARLLGLKYPQQVYPLCKSGQLKYKRIGVRGYRIFKDSLKLTHPEEE